MHLLGLTLEHPGAITGCIHGSFTGTPGIPEIVLCRGQRILELYQVSGQQMRLVTRTDVFGIIRSLCPFKLPGAKREYVVIGSDSGRITILEVSAAHDNAFVRVQLETFGRSGCRRIVPGEFIASDPRGRSVMIAAVEKQKLAYVLSRDSKNNLTISSPQEAHKSHVIVFSLCGVDVGYENPQFAALEFDYTNVHGERGTSDRPHKVLTYYELDLGLNNTARKYSDPVDNTANIVTTVPGWKDGPGGLLVCAVNFVYWMNHGKPTIRIPLPRRAGTPADREVMVTCVALHQQRGMFFFLLQTEDGDLFKLTFDYTGDVVNSADIIYFDTLPLASSINILRTGHLFLAAEFGDNQLYQFRALGERKDTVYGEPVRNARGDVFETFQPRALVNLALVDQRNSLAPITDCLVLNRGFEETAQIYALCGRGSGSSLRVLRHGIVVNQVAEVALPHVPTDVWTVRCNAKEEFDRYIVLSFTTSTMVLAIGEMIEESTTSGLVTNEGTLAVGLVGEDTIIQVHVTGIRLIRADGRMSEWQPPGRRTIAYAAMNTQQVIIALSEGNGELFYFEYDPVLGHLNEVERRELGHDISAIDIAPASNITKTRGRFAAVSESQGRVQLLSLAPETCLQDVSVQIVPAKPVSLALTENAETATSTVVTASGDVQQQSVHVTPSLFLNVGLENGVMCRSTVDGISGDLSDTHNHFIGTRKVSLRKVTVRDAVHRDAEGKNMTFTALVAMSSRSWLCYPSHSRFTMTPLSGIQLSSTASFASEQCHSGYVSIYENALRVFTLDKLDQPLNQTRFPLPRTPRKFLYNSATDTFAIMERDNGSSGIRVIDPTTGATISLIEFPSNEGAISMADCVLQERSTSVACIAVGTVISGASRAATASGESKTVVGRIHIYTYTASRTLEEMHVTDVEGSAPPRALHPFMGRLLVGVGNCLRMYELGRKKLLKKSEIRQLRNMVCQIHSIGTRVVIGDVNESFTFYQYTVDDNSFIPLADDTSPRWLSAGTMVDHDTVVCGDKFGTISVLRMPQELSEKLRHELQTTGNLAVATDKPHLGGAPHRLQLEASLYIGDTVTSIQRTSLYPGAPEFLLYTTVLGGIGGLIPFEKREDVNFFQQLEMYMRAEKPPLCGRDHIAFRGSFQPVKEVVDGDLCEQFTELSMAQQTDIASELERVPSEVVEKLEDIRHTRLL